MASILAKAWVVVSKVLQHFCSYQGPYLSQSEGSNAELDSIHFFFLLRFRNGHPFHYISHKKEGMIKKSQTKWFLSRTPAQLLYKRMQDDGFVDRCSFPSSFTPNIWCPIPLWLLDLHCPSQIQPTLSNILSTSMHRSGRSHDWIWKDVSLPTIINLLFMGLVSGVDVEVDDYEDTLTLWCMTLVVLWTTVVRSTVRRRIVSSKISSIRT